MYNLIILFLYLDYNIYTGFTSSYYFLPYGYYLPFVEINVTVPKGFNIGVSLKKENMLLKINYSIIDGWTKNYYSDPPYSSEKSLHFKEICVEFSFLFSIFLKEFDFYFGPGVSSSLINIFYYDKTFRNSVLDTFIEVNFDGDILGFPLIFGVEKEIFKRFGIFWETYSLFYGLLNLEWERKGEKIKVQKDFLVLGGLAFPLNYQEGKLGRMTIGIKYKW